MSNIKQQRGRARCRCGQRVSRQLAARARFFFDATGAFFAKAVRVRFGSFVIVRFLRATRVIFLMFAFAAVRCFLLAMDGRTDTRPLRRCARSTSLARAVDFSQARTREGIDVEGAETVLSSWCRVQGGRR